MERGLRAVVGCLLTALPLLACSRLVGDASEPGATEEAARTPTHEGTLFGDPRMRAAGSIRSATFAGSFVFTLDSSPRIDRWALPSGDHRGTLRSPCEESSSARAIVASPDGRRIAVACSSEGVVVLDVGSGKQVLRVPIGDDYVHELIGSTDGAVFGLRTSQGVRLVSAKDGSTLRPESESVDRFANHGSSWVGVTSSRVFAFGTKAGERWSLDAAEGGRFQDAAFSPDGSRLAVFDDGAGVVRFLDSRTGKVLAETAAGYGGCGLVFPSSDLAWLGDGLGVKFVSSKGPSTISPLRVRRACSPLVRSPDGAWVASLDGATLEVFDAAKRERIPVGAGLESGGEAIVFSPDSKTVVARGGRGDLLRVNLGTGAVDVLAVPSVSDVTLAGDGTIAFISDGAVQLLGADGTPAPVALGDDNEAVLAAFTPDGKTLVTLFVGERAVDIALVDVVTRSVRKTVDLPCPEVDTMQLDRTGNLMVLTGCGDTAVFEIATGRELLAWDVFGEVYGIAEVRPGELVVYAEDGRDEPKAFVWFPGRRHGEPHEAHNVCALAANGRLVACDEKPNAVVVRAAVSHEVLATITLAGLATRIAFSPDGSVLVAALENGLVQVLDVSTLVAPEIPAAPAALALRADDLRMPVGVALGNPRTRTIDIGSGTGFEWSPDGRSILHTSSDSVGITDARTGERRELVFTDRPTAAWSADGARVAFVDRDDKLRIVGAGGKGEKTLDGEASAPLAWSKNGVLASGTGTHGKIQLRDANGKPLRTLTPAASQGGWLGGLAFSPDGGRLLSFGDHAATMIWDAATGDGRELHGHTGSVRQASWSPDGRWLATSGLAFDGTVIVWKGDTLEPAHVLRGMSPMSIAFSPDGKRLAVASDDEIVIWNSATGRPSSRHSLKFRPTYLEWGKDGSLAVAGASELHLWKP